MTETETNKTTYDVARELQNIISTQLVGLTNYQLLSVLCEYSDYYKTRVASALKVIKREVEKRDEDNSYSPTPDDEEMPMVLFHDFYKSCETELDYLQNHTQEENKTFMSALSNTVNDPSELISYVKQYIEEN